jgi:hypothetical protein
MKWGDGGMGDGRKEGWRAGGGGRGDRDRDRRGRDAERETKRDTLSLCDRDTGSDRDRKYSMSQKLWEVGRLKRQRGFVQ